MASYRGVDKNRIVASVREGLDFLASCSVGPAVDRLIHPSRTRPILSALSNAASDETMLAAMQSTGANVLFCPFEDVFLYSALNSNDSAVIEQYGRLREWSAFAPMSGFTPPDVDADIFVYLVDRYLLHLSREYAGPSGREGLERRFSEINEGYIDDQGSLGRDVDSLLAIYDLSRDAGLDLVRSARPVKERTFVSIARKLAGFDGAELNASLPTAIECYTTNCGSLADLAQIETITTPLYQHLGRFVATDEFCNWIDVVATATDRLIASLYCSRPAIKACADAMPSREFRNSRGERIELN